MNILGFLGTSNKAMDALVKGGDALVFTKEERAVFDQKKAEIWLETQRVVNEQSTPTSISRRVVAMTVLGPFIFLLIGSAIISAFGVFLDFTPGKALAIAALADHWKTLAVDNFGFAVSTVVVFYYGPHMIQQIKK